MPRNAVAQSEGAPAWFFCGSSPVNQLNWYVSNVFSAKNGSEDEQVAQFKSYLSQRYGLPVSTLNTGCTTDSTETAIREQRSQTIREQRSNPGYTVVETDWGPQATQPAHKPDANTNPPRGWQFSPELNRSSCVREVFMDFGRALRNDCTVPVNVAYCSYGPDNDLMRCKASPGSFGTTYAISTINSIRPGGFASNPSALAKNNHMPFFACANEDGKVQAVLTGYGPPQGTCVHYK